jgi:hypothetical protein
MLMMMMFQIKPVVPGTMEKVSLCRVALAAIKKCKNLTSDEKWKLELEASKIASAPTIEEAEQLLKTFLSNLNSSAL